MGSTLIGLYLEAESHSQAGIRVARVAPGGGAAADVMAAIKNDVVLVTSCAVSPSFKTFSAGESVTAHSTIIKPPCLSSYTNYN